MDNEVLIDHKSDTTSLSERSEAGRVPGGLLTDSETLSTYGTRSSMYLTAESDDDSLDSEVTRSLLGLNKCLGESTLSFTSAGTLLEEDELFSQSYNDIPQGCSTPMSLCKKSQEHYEDDNSDHEGRGLRKRRKKSFNSESDSDASYISFAGQLNERMDQALRFVGLDQLGGDIQRSLTGEIKGYEVIGMDRKKYTVYKIEVSDRHNKTHKSWFVQRRYSDFLKMHSSIKKEYPEYSTDLDIPPKRWIGNNLEPTFLSRRLVGLQMYLTKLLEKEVLLQNYGVRYFLNLNGRDINDLHPSNQFACTALESLVSELRIQLRKVESIERKINNLEKENKSKENKILKLKKENENLTSQKECLAEALRSAFHHTSPESTSSLSYSSTEESKRNALMNPRNRRRRTISSPDTKVETLEDFTTKFNLKKYSEKKKP